METKRNEKDSAKTRPVKTRTALPLVQNIEN
jgi:hypothetical protein